jgi:COP9 signalosome complex subunit 1
MGYDDLGRYCQQVGMLNEAAKAFNKEREYCQLPAHISIMVTRLINVYIEQESWLSVETNVQKLRSLPQNPQNPAESEKVGAKLSAALGLAELAVGNYAKAAYTFLNCNPRMVQAKLDDPNSEEAYNEVITPNDIATYGALCALATKDRRGLQTQVLENTNFRNYLELEPHLRRAISTFVAGKYAQCLEILTSYRTDYLLDLYLSPHFDKLYGLIRNKAIEQYFVPFSSVTFKSLAASFNTTDEAIVDILTDLIKNKTLPARLDIEKGLLVADKVEPRNEMYDSAMKASKDYEHTLHLRLVRIGVSTAGLEIKASSKGSATDNLLNPDQAPKSKGKGPLRGYFS